MRVTGSTLSTVKLLQQLSPQIREAFRELLRDSHEVCEATLRRCTSIARNLTQRLIENRVLQVRGRVHAELVRIARKHQQGNSRRVEVIDAPTNQEIADCVNSHREQFNRDVRALEKTGLIKWNSRAHVIFDIDEFEQLAELWRVDE